MVEVYIILNSDLSFKCYDLKPIGPEHWATTLN